MKCLIFCEGENDRKFIQRALKDPLHSVYDRVEDLCTSSIPDKKIKDMIFSMKKINFDYIYLKDKDEGCLVEKRNERIAALEQSVENHGVVIVCYELESWLYAGLGKSGCEKLNLEYLSTTDNLTKEEFFERGRKAGIQNEYSFRNKTLNEFKIKYAKKCNASFARFAKKYFPNYLD